MDSYPSTKVKRTHQKNYLKKKDCQQNQQIQIH